VLLGLPTNTFSGVVKEHASSVGLALAFATIMRIGGYLPP
jgi:hypothetical protein